MIGGSSNADGQATGAPAGTAPASPSPSPPQSVGELQAALTARDAEIAMIKEKTKAYVTRLRADHDAVAAEKAELQVHLIFKAYC